MPLHTSSHRAEVSVGEWQMRQMSQLQRGSWWKLRRELQQDLSFCEVREVPLEWIETFDQRNPRRWASDDYVHYLRLDTLHGPWDVFRLNTMKRAVRRFSSMNIDIFEGTNETHTAWVVDRTWCSNYSLPSRPRPCSRTRSSHVSWSGLDLRAETPGASAVPRRLQWLLQHEIDVSKPRHRVPGHCDTFAGVARQTRKERPRSRRNQLS